MQPFVLTTTEIPDYDIHYLGKEKVDEIGCYAFAVKPKKMVQGKRYFEGQIWVDDRDLQIVKTYGKGVGASRRAATTSSRSSRPTASRSTASTGSRPTPTPTTRCTSRTAPVRIRMTVKYQDYKKYEGKSTIRFGDVVEDKTTPPDKKNPPDEEEIAEKAESARRVEEVMDARLSRIEQGQRVEQAAVLAVLPSH